MRHPLPADQHHWTLLKRDTERQRCPKKCIDADLLSSKKTRVCFLFHLYFLLGLLQAACSSYFLVLWGVKGRWLVLETSAIFWLTEKFQFDSLDEWGFRVGTWESCCRVRSVKCIRLKSFCDPELTNSSDSFLFFFPQLFTTKTVWWCNGRTKVQQVKKKAWLKHGYIHDVFIFHSIKTCIDIDMFDWNVWTASVDGATTRNK